MYFYWVVLFRLETREALLRLVFEETTEFAALLVDDRALYVCTYAKHVAQFKIDPSL